MYVRLSNEVTNDLDALFRAPIRDYFYAALSVGQMNAVSPDQSRQHLAVGLQIIHKVRQVNDQCFARANGAGNRTALFVFTAKT